MLGQRGQSDYRMLFSDKACPGALPAPFDIHLGTGGNRHFVHHLRSPNSTSYPLAEEIAQLPTRFHVLCLL
jgi:hypothetical protein